ncbi:MAG TPA: tetratricopeptide repeat protein, partial [Terriglobia bacterium]|nr:tetratricopeptide repeat protein [Terriglobia bacterium]
LAGAVPWAYHLLNILIHACVTAVVFLLTLELWKNLKVAGIAGLLFALHPVHTEPVIWIAAIPDLGYTLFFLLALYFYVLDYKPALHALIACVACYAVALLWKESAITFLPCIVLYDVLVVRQFRLRRYAPLMAVTVIYLTTRMLVFGTLSPSVVHEGLSLPTQALTAISHLGIYLEKLVLPLNLTFFYRLQASFTPDLRVCIVLLVLAVAAWKLRGQVAWSFYWIPLTLLPALAVSRVVVPLAERNLYLASVGFVWLAAQVLASLTNARAFALAGVLSAGYLAVDALRVPVWRDELTLFGHALQLDPDNHAIRLRMSTEFGRRGRYDEAMAQLEEILKRSPKHLNALTSKAGLHVFKKEWEAVDATCARAFEVDPNSALCHLDVGLADLQRGKKDEAWRRFDLAYQSNPRMWQAVLQQGTMAMDVGDFPAAVRKFELVLSQSPTPHVFTILGVAHARLGNPSKATAAFGEALRIDPAYMPARQALGLALKQ